MRCSNVVLMLAHRRHRLRRWPVTLDNDDISPILGQRLIYKQDLPPDTIHLSNVVLMLARVADGGATLKQHWLNVSFAAFYHV